MAEVKILIQGFTNADTQEGEEEKTCPTITLIKDKDFNIIVDPGVLESQEVLIDKLKEEVLSIDDIDIVCITHSHIDHYRNIGMFPKAKTLEFFGLWNGQTADDWQEQFSDDIRIIKTPGHNYDAISLLVKTEKGTVAVVGDVFWKQGLPKEDPYATNSKELEQSRQKILALADYIIPGHGPMYKVER
jgi:glyoxylase-like metal-dependent hydrolase (beta-lactamase superfamily II)